MLESVIRDQAALPIACATVILFPSSSLPELPDCLPFPEGTTPDSIAQKLDQASLALLATEKRLARAERGLDREIALFAPGGDPQAAARDWSSQHVMPHLEPTWLDPTWAHRLYDLVMALDTLAEYLPNWCGLGDMARAVIALHDRIGLALVSAAENAGHRFIAAAAAALPEAALREEEGPRLPKRHRARRAEHHLGDRVSLRQRHRRRHASGTQHQPSPGVRTQVLPEPRPVLAPRQAFLVAGPWPRRDERPSLV